MNLPHLRTAACLLGLAAASACGSKTDLAIDPPDAAPPPAEDAGMDAAVTLDSGFDAGVDAAPVCVPGIVALDPSTVEVVFVVDRSGSMLAAFDGRPPVGGERSRWEILESAMGNALSVFDDRIGVGAKFFPSQSIRAEEGPCDVFSGLDVEIGPGRAPGVISQFSRWNPNGGTPVAVATRQALDALLARADDNNAQFIVVATDGAPTCGESPRADALEVIREAHEEHGVDVYVVGIASTDPEVELLDVMAVTGGRPRPDSEPRRFYDASDPGLLESLLSEITRDLVQCVFAVPIPPDEDDVVEVLVSGDSIPRDPTREDGWDWTNERRAQLSLFGEACERAIASGGAVRANITCN
ncbi:MAG: vWA domain-containing protein [Sandaracinaceae bacterium]